MQKKVLAALVASVMAGQAMAITVVDDGTNSFTIGGHVGARYNTDAKAVKGDASRFNFGFEHKMTEATTAFGKGEWGFDVTNTDGDVFFNRLGYVGVMNEQLGTVIFGKAWSSYSKVSTWTDMFSAAPASGSAAGTYGADGHALGTARADDVLQYTYSGMGLTVSAQAQLGERTVAKDADAATPALVRDSSYGMSASYALPMGLSVGVAYNQADVSNKVGGKDFKATSTVFGIKYDADKIYAAFTYSALENRDIDVAGTAVSFDDADGMEFYASYQLNDMFKVEGGYIQLDGKDGGVDSNSEVKAMPFGLVYTQGPVQLSGTYQFQKSKLEGKEQDDTAVFQARYYF